MALAITLGACARPSTSPTTVQGPLAHPRVEAASALEMPLAVGGLTELAIERATVEMIDAVSRGAPGLRKLTLIDAESEAVEGIARLEHLESLVVSRPPRGSLPPLAGLTKLAHLEILEASLGEGAEVTNLSVLGRLPRLETLRLESHRTALSAILRALPPMARLRSLTVAGGGWDPDQNGMAMLAHSPLLTQLSLSSIYTRSFASLEGIEHTSVRELELSNVHVTSLAPLAETVTLRRLVLAALVGADERGRNIWNLDHVPSGFWRRDPEGKGYRADLSGLAKVQQLRELEIIAMKMVDLDFLQDLEDLELLRLVDSHVVDPKGLRGATACKLEVSTDVEPSAWSRAEHARAERLSADLRAYFARRTCPRHCDRGCSLGGTYFLLRAPPP